MREFRKPGYDWEMMMYELSEICEEVYGVPYDLQMGERGQGEYDVVTTGQLEEREGYWTGLGQGHGYDGKYIEGNAFVYFDGDEEDADGNFLDMSEQAIAKWQSQEKTISYSGASPSYDRPFDEVGENGEYTFYQPSLSCVVTDLAKKGIIPEGTWMIKIDW